MSDIEGVPYFINNVVQIDDCGINNECEDESQISMIDTSYIRFVRQSLKDSKKYDKHDVLLQPRRCGDLSIFIFYLRKLSGKNVKVTRIANETLSSVCVDVIQKNCENIERWRYTRDNKFFLHII